MLVRAFISTACTGALLLGLCALSGCATTPAPDALNENAGASDAETIGEAVVVPTETLKEGAGVAPQDSPPPEQPEPDVDLAYRITPGDMLSFRSFDDEKLSMQTVVRYDGCISLQMIPDLHVAGLSREEAEEAIREAYSTLYVDPQLTLTIMDAKGKVFTVLGEVARPAEYPYTRPISLLDAISAAGGMRVNQRSGDSYIGGQGQLVKAFIIREHSGERQVMDFDLRNFRHSGPHPSDARVLPGDIVYVPESQNLVYLLGEVGRANVYAITEGLTLLRLLAFASGFQESTARLRHVLLLREINETETKIMVADVRHIIKTGQDVLLEPGDVIYVPRKRLVNAREFVQQATGTISPILSLGQQVMSLYTQAYDAYYMKDRMDLLFKSGADRTNLILDNALRNIAATSPLQFAPSSAR